MVCKGVACHECTKNCATLHQKSKDASPNVSRFFKIMFGKDFRKVLYLPPKFAGTVKHLAGQETQIEDSSGLRWSVTFSFIDGSLALRKGWDKFSVDHGLEEGQFLIFNYLNGSHFVVQIYGKSACEKIDFENGRPPRSKRLRVSPETVSLDEPFQTVDFNLSNSVDVNSSKKQIPADSVSSRSKIRNGEKNVEETNAKSQKLNLPIPMEVEDLTCMINRDDGYYQREETNFLYDLSLFEMDDKTNKSVKGLCGNGNTEQATTKGDDIQLDAINANKTNGDCNDILTDKFGEGLDPKMDSSRADNMGRSKVNGDGRKIAVSDANQINGKSCRSKVNGDGRKMAVSDTNQINGKSSGEIFVDKFDKASNAKIASSQSVKTDQKKIKGNGTKMAAVHINQINVKSGENSVDKFEKASGSKRAPPLSVKTESNKTNEDILTDKFSIKISDYINFSKIVQDNVSKPQNGGDNHFQASDNESPLKGHSKIAMKEFSSSVLKKPFGQRTMKNEPVELGEEGKGFPEVFFEKKPTILGVDGQMSSPVVKVEPDLPYDTVPPYAISSFSVEVKTQSYLELPVHIPAAPGRRERGRGKVVYLRDSRGRLWPLLNPDLFAVKALTSNWKRFCKKNGIKPGDECRFQAEDGKTCFYRVDVAHRR